MLLNDADLRRVARWEEILKIAAKPVRLCEIATALGKVRDDIKHDMDAMIKFGYFNMTKRGRFTFYRANRTTVDLEKYTAVRKVHMDKCIASMHGAREKQVSKEEANVSGAKLIKLTDTTHWTPTAKKSRNAWTGTTLGAMTF